MNLRGRVFQGVSLKSLISLNVNAWFFVFFLPYAHVIPTWKMFIYFEKQENKSLENNKRLTIYE